MEEISNLIAFTLFGNAFIFLGALLALIVFLFIADVEENGFYATAVTIIFIGLNQFKGDFHIQDYINWWDIGLYLVIGLGFALMRTFFKGRELTKEYTNDYNYYNRADLTGDDAETIEEYITNNKSNFDLKEHVFRWWLLFPISGLVWLFGTVFKDTWNLVYDKIGGVFNRILNL
jgi:hypothetical protein